MNRRMLGGRLWVSRDTHTRAHTDMHMNVPRDTDVFPTRGTYTYSSGSVLLSGEINLLMSTMG